MICTDYPRRSVALIALSLIAVFASTKIVVANTLTENDTTPFLLLYKAALTLSSDINNDMVIMNRSGYFNQADCLSDLENSLDSIMDALLATHDLITVSAQMKNFTDEVTVNTTLAARVSYARKKLVLNRRYALEQGALCSMSALVNTYAQKTAALADRATVLFSGINDRLGWLARRP